MKKLLCIVKIIVCLLVTSVLFMLYLNFKIISKENANSQKFTKFTSNPPKVPPVVLNDLIKKLKREQPSPAPPAITTTQPSPPKRRIHPFATVAKYRSQWEKLPYRSGKSIHHFQQWQESAEDFCDGKITFYDGNFLHTSSMFLDKTKAKSGNFGGEDIETVILQEENAEYYEYEMGFFCTKCPLRPSYSFQGKNHLNEWLFNLQTQPSPTPPAPVYQVDDFTIAVMRYEYANLYHTMTDWYNAFLIKEFFNKTSAETNILVVDTHPYGMLDSAWSHLFNYTRRLSKLPANTHFSNLAWGIQGYNSPLKVSWQDYQLPLIEEFRTFFLNAFNVIDDRRFTCQKLNILIIWRRDYLAHPRNPKGTVSRKIANEEELVKHLRKNLPSDKFAVRASQIDRFSIATQLEMVVWADVLVGMHGAGLTHAVFLKSSSGLVELQPNYYSGQHFEAIARWRSLSYSIWRNEDALNELDSSTIIPPDTLLSLINQTAKAICPPAQYSVLFGLKAS